MAPMKNLFLSLIVVGLLSACSSQNDEPRANAEVKIDADDTKDSIKEGFAKAEKEIKNGAEKAGDKLSDAGDAIKDKFEEAKDKLSDDDKASIKVEVKKD